MAQYIVLNTVNIPPVGLVYAGTILNDQYDADTIARVPGAGGTLATLPNAALEAAGELARAAKAAGHGEQADEIMLAARSSEPFAAGAVTTAMLAAGAVTAAKIGALAVVEAAIGTGAVTVTKIGAGAVTATKIGAGAVVEAAIGAGAVTADKIGAGAVTAAKLANGAGVAALLAGGLGNSAAYPKETVGVQTLLQDTVDDRVVLIIVEVTETFANNVGTQAAFTIGVTGLPVLFAPAADFIGALAGKTFVYAGVLTGGLDLIATATAALLAGTGGIAVTVLALPQEV